MSRVAPRILFLIMTVFTVGGPSLAQQESRFYQPTLPVIVSSRSRPTVDRPTPTSEELETRIKTIQALSTNNVSEGEGKIDFLDRIAVVSSNGWISADVAVRLNVEGRNIYCLSSGFSSRVDMSKHRFELKWPAPNGSLAGSTAVQARFLGLRWELLFVETDSQPPTQKSFDFRKSNVPGGPAEEIFLLGYGLSYYVPDSNRLTTVKTTVKKVEGKTGERWQSPKIPVRSTATALAVRSDGRVWGITLRRASLGTQSPMTIVPLHEIEKCLQPVTDELRPRRSGSVMTINYSGHDLLGEFEATTLHVGRPRDIHGSAKLKEGNLVAKKMRPIRLISGGLSSMRIRGQLALKDGFVMQLERMRFDGTSVLEAPMFWNTRDPVPAMMTIDQTLQRKAKSTWKDTPSDLLNAPQPVIDLEPKQVSKPFEISSMKGQIIDLGQKSAFGSVHWTTDGKYVVGLTQLGITKLELSSGTIVGSIRLPGRVRQVDLARDGIVALSEQMAYLIDLDSLEVTASCWIPEGENITAATGSSQVFASSKRNLYRVRWGKRAERLDVTMDSQPPPLFLRDVALTETGAHLFLTDGYRIDRFGVLTNGRIRWQESSKTLLQSRYGGSLYYPQGGKVVSLFSSPKTGPSHQHKRADYPNGGMFVFHIEHLDRPIYGARFSSAYAIHPSMGGYIGGVNRTTGGESLVFADNRGRPLRTIPNASLLDANSLQISPNGKQLFANMMRSVIVDLPDQLQDPEAFRAQTSTPRTHSIGRPVERSNAGGKDGWQLQRLPWDVSATDNMMTWSADGQLFYVITSDPPEQQESSQRPFPKRFGDTVRVINSSLVEESTTRFQEPIDFVGLSSEGLVVRYRRWQRVALVHPRSLKWIKDVGIPAPQRLATSPASNHVWTFDGDGLHEYELPTGQLSRSYSHRELAGIVQKAELPHSSSIEISRLRTGKQNPSLRLSPDGKSLYLGCLGICKFDIGGEDIRLVDCSGASRDAKDFQPIYVSPDGSMVAKIGCATNLKGSMNGQHNSGTLVVSSANLGELKIDATMPGGCRGFAFDPVSQSVFSVRGQQVLVRPASQTEPTEMRLPVHGLNSIVLSASPAGAGTLITLVNEPFWLSRTSEPAPEPR